MPVIAGADVYRTDDFKKFWSDKYYGSVESMRAAIAKLKASRDIDLPTLEYGRYQPVLVPLDEWPNDGGKVWAKELGLARLHLTDQPNEVPLFEGERPPLTRCALLDAAIRKCFNSEPPIPMDVHVRQQDMNSPDKDIHTVDLKWIYGDGEDKPPTCLRFTMTCPYKPVRHPYQ